MPSQATGRIATTLGRNIRLARDTAGLTQRQLAEAVDVDPMLVSKWERGRHRPNDENLLALADALDCSLVWFYTDHSSTERAA